MPRWWPLASALVAAAGWACTSSPTDRFTPTPATAPPPLTHVSQTPRSAHEPSLAAFSDGFVVAWYDTRDGHGEIYARALAADATPTGPEWRLTNGGHDAFEADVQAAGEHDFVIGWYEKTSQGALLPRIGRWSRDGQPRWVATLAPGGRNTVVRVDGDLVFAAWVQDEDESRAGVWAGWWDATGSASVPPRRVADASRTTWNLTAAAAPASSPAAPRAWLAFDARSRTRSDEIFLVGIEASSSRVTRLTADDGVSSKYPDVSPSGDRVAMTWFDTVDKNEDVYLAVGPASRLLRQDALTGAGTRVTSTPGHSIGNYLAWNRDRVRLAWTDDSVGQHEVYAQPFDASGRPLAPAERITDTPAASLIPAIKPWRSGFALTWTEYEAPETSSHGDGRAQIAMKLIP